MRVEKFALAMDFVIRVIRESLTVERQVSPSWEFFDCWKCISLQIPRVEFCQRILPEPHLGNGHGHWGWKEVEACHAWGHAKEVRKAQGRRAGIFWCTILWHARSTSKGKPLAYRLINVMSTCYPTYYRFCGRYASQASYKYIIWASSLWPAFYHTMHGIRIWGLSITLQGSSMQTDASCSFRGFLPILLHSIAVKLVTRFGECLIVFEES